MQNESMPPQPLAQSPIQQPINATPVNYKVALNPIPHLKRGIGALIKINLGAGLIAVLISSVVSVGLTVAFLYAVFLTATSFFLGAGIFPSGGNMSSLYKTLAVFTGVTILAVLIIGYFGSVVTRIIITGSRGQKENLGHAYGFVLSRLGKIVLTYLFIFAIFLVGTLVVSISGMITPILAILLGIVGVIASIIFVFRLLYIPLILVDDENPGGPMAVLRRSSVLWKKSGGAIVVYGLVCLVISIVINALIGSGSNSSSAATTYNGTSPFASPLPAAFSFAIGAVLLSSFVSNCLGALISSGAASIYNDARELVDGAPPGTAANTAAPTPPAASPLIALAPFSGPVDPTPAVPPLTPPPPAPEQTLPPQPPSSNPVS